MVGGEDGEDAKKRPYRMCGIELCVPARDLVCKRHSCSRRVSCVIVGSIKSEPKDKTVRELH